MIKYDNLMIPKGSRYKARRSLTIRCVYIMENEVIPVYMLNKGTSLVKCMIVYFLQWLPEQSTGSIILL